MIATSRWSDWAPGMAQFRSYQRGWLRGDTLASLTVAAYLVPQVMAYATLAGVSAVTGLWAAIVALAAYVVFGSSRQLSVGPESTTALMTAAVLAPMAAGGGAHYGVLAAVLAVLVGALCFVGALAAGVSGKPVVAAGVGRVHDGHRDCDDNQPARQDHRRTGVGRPIRRFGASFRRRHQPCPLADDNAGRFRSRAAAHAWALGAQNPGAADRSACRDPPGIRVVVECQRY